MKKLINRAIFSFERRGFFNILPDELYLKIMYWASLGKKLDLKDPKAFNEKLQWLKLYNRDPEYTKMVDKFEAKKYVADIIGEEYIIPTLGVWDNADDVDFAALPDKFVIKCTHNSGKGMYICKDKSQMDETAVREGLRAGLRQNYYKRGREWPYKNVKPRIIAEQYMEDEKTAELRDYKFMCFDGEVKSLFVCSDRFSKDSLHVTFFDRDWNHLPFERQYPLKKDGIDKPQNLDLMIKLAEKLSADIPFLRVDLYEINGKIYFGELTFFPGGGNEAFTPEEWDYKFGSYIKLPNKRKEG